MARRRGRLTHPTGAGDPGTPAGEVIQLGTTPPAPPEVPTTRPRGLHGIAIASTAGFALIALLCFVGFITVGWTGTSRRIVIATLMFSVIGFIASASASVLTAARATYVSYRPARSNETEETETGELKQE